MGLSTHSFSTSGSRAVDIEQGDRRPARPKTRQRRQSSFTNLPTTGWIDIDEERGSACWLMLALISTLRDASSHLATWTDARVVLASKGLGLLTITRPHLLFPAILRGFHVSLMSEFLDFHIHLFSLLRCYSPGPCPSHPTTYIVSIQAVVEQSLRPATT